MNVLRHSMSRRKFLKSTATASAALALSPVAAPAVRGAGALKLGYVSPQSGPLAAFAEADKFIIENFLASVKDAVKIGNQTYAVEVLVKDSQSNPNRAAEVAKELIVKDKVDQFGSASQLIKTNPVLWLCELTDR